MNELVKERSVGTLVEVDEEFNDTSQNDASMLKIVSNIETRMIQEDIQKKWQEYGEIKRSWKDFIALAAGLGIIVPSFWQMLELTHDDFSFVAILIALGFATGLLTVIIGTACALGNAPSIRDDVVHEINALRQNLAEKSLNIEILKKDKVKITEEWDEIMALDENDDYVKVLMRVVKDETTGLETIESKMLKNQ